MRIAEESKPRFGFLENGPLTTHRKALLLGGAVTSRNGPAILNDTSFQKTCLVTAKHIK